MKKSSSCSFITNRFDNFKAFAETTLEDIFGDRLQQIPYKEINTLQHILFLNTKSGFEGYPLPREAQFSAGFHVGVADYNNNGNEDLFLSQNFFGLPPKVPRLDAGRDLWLQGDGTGDLIPVSGSETGIRIYGEQRGSAFSDFNNDERVDLAASQNNAGTKLYLNNTDRRGYSITLRGPSRNRDGIGSAVRLIYGDGSKGPLREFQAGSGYWSQNSFTQVLGAEPNKEVTGIEIYWFDGKRQVLNISGEWKSFIIEYPE